MSETYLAKKARLQRVMTAQCEFIRKMTDAEWVEFKRRLAAVANPGELRMALQSFEAARRGEACVVIDGNLKVQSN